MIKLKIGYAIGGFVTGLIILFNFLSSLPDGKLHIIYCDVGQGDAAYILFPDGKDMLVDGGPNDGVLQCLGRHMPFWDRTIDIVLLTHPEKDHMQGILSVLERYHVGYLVRSDIANTSEGYVSLIALQKARGVEEKLVTAGERVAIGPIGLTVLWPSSEQIALMRPPTASIGHAVLGAATSGLNDGSVVFLLRYGTFDALFSGDADTHVEAQYRGKRLADSAVEVLKVPHHASRTGMSKAYLDWLNPQLAIISVGRNTYGHPSPEMLKMLADSHIRLLRTDKEGDIEVVSDGGNWQVSE